MLGSAGAYGAILSVILKLCAKAPATHSEKQKTYFFKPDKYHTALKNHFDEFNLFNSRIQEPKKL